MADKIKLTWFDRQGVPHTVDLLTGTDLALLDLAEDEGLAMPFGCRSGSCGSCRIEIIEGHELLAPRTFLEEDTLSRHQDPANIRLACRATLIAPGNLVIKIATVMPFKG